MDFFWVYDIPTWKFALLCISFFVLIAVFGLLALRRVIFSRIIPQAHNDVVSYFMAGMNAIYGITLGLIAVGAWENFKSVDDTVSREAAALGSLYQDTKLIGPPLRDSLHAQLREYCRYTIEDAWPVQQKGTIPKGGTERLTRFQNTLVTFQPTTEAEKVVLMECFKQLNHVIEHRRMRLQAVNEGLPIAVWYVILFGGILNIIITWFFMTDRFRVHLLMTAMFAALLGSLVFLVAAMDHPFRGEVSVTAEAFEVIYENMRR
jgi:hypothetical protein